MKRVRPLRVLSDLAGIRSLVLAGSFSLLSLSGCTEQLPGSFRYKQQLEVFSTSQEVNTSIDLLWVVDNSASMDVSQKKLRDGFSAFARAYLKPTWDIRLAVITTDTYLAHAAFDGYLNTVIPGTVGWRSNHIAQRPLDFINPEQTPNLWNNATKTFPNGVRYGDISPAWGSNWARLIPGIHDGPMTTLCSELLPYFLKGTSLCSSRDQVLPATAEADGLRPCVSPDSGAGESSVTSCINTTQVDVLHTQSPILETQPPTGVAADEAWVDALVEKFLVNASVGSSGQGSERGISSVLQLLADNESTETRFFRPGSLRGILFMSDEDDQSMDLSVATPGTTPQTHYQCDQERLAELNTGDSRVTTSCPNSSNRCPEKVIDGFSYRVSYCPAESAPLLSVASAKQQLDTFFTELDEGTQPQPNYFVAAIIPTSAAAIQQLQEGRISEDSAVGALKNWAVDRGDRYIELVDRVSNGSLAMNIAESDYTPILETIGRTIVSKKATFKLQREPSSLEELMIWVRHNDETRTPLSDEQFSIEGTTLRITDLDLVLSLVSTDRIVIDYQPKNLK